MLEVVSLFLMVAAIGGVYIACALGCMVFLEAGLGICRWMCGEDKD